MAITKDDILEAVGGMTVMELNDLVKAFEEKFGVSAAAMAAAGPAAGAGAAGAEDPGAHGAAGEPLPGGGPDELEGGRGRHDDHLVAGALELADQEDRLVGRDPGADTDHRGGHGISPRSRPRG